jgi:hypothetical protein
MNLVAFAVTLLGTSASTPARLRRGAADLMSSGLRVHFAGLCFLLLTLAPLLSAQGPRIAATQAFNAGCSSAELSGIVINIDIGVHTFHENTPSPARTDPEWAVIITDPSKGVLDQPPQIVEGTVTIPNFVPGTATPGTATNDYQATSEVAEEDFGWTHFTHDYTFKLTPDSAYEKVLAYFAKSTGGYDLQPDMEVEWENASMMDEKEGFQRIWGAVPEFVWPGYGDRIWLMGQWIFDCSHQGSNDVNYVRYETEIHPPRILVTQRVNHTTLDSFPRQRTSEPSYPFSQSYLPVTGEPEAGSTTLPTWVPLTEADIFVSGNGGGARDLCSLIAAVPPYTDGDSVISGFGYTTCGNGHTNPVSPVNDRNYVFDLYPPVTDYTMADTSGGAYTMINGNKVYPWTVFPPTADASLQYRIVDHDGEIPAHACGGNDTTNCVTVAPIICLIDSSTPPPNQSETSCPTVPARPTRLRVILPFNGSNANYFAKSILLGWDDVPNPNDDVGRVRTFKVKLHKFTVNDNGSGATSGDWRVFLNMNGQWRYMSPYFDTDAFSGNGINAFDGGNNVCNGEALTDNGEDDCFRFDNTPFLVTVTHEDPIYIGVGGFVARDVETDDNPAGMCRNFPGGCDPRITYDGFKDLATANDDRIGTQEWRLLYSNEYGAPNPDSSTVKFGCQITTVLGCNIQYSTTFTVEEIPAGTPPTSADIKVGTPMYTASGTFVTSATPITLSPQTDATNFQYRFHKQGGALPTFSSTLPFPVHWNSADLSGNPLSVNVSLNTAGGAAGDGAYDFEYSAEQSYSLLEPRHTTTLILDNTPPVTTFVQPAAGGTYGHSDILTLNYSEGDGTGSGVDASTVNPKMDGETSSQFGTSLANMSAIYLESMSLGTHTFSVDAADHLGNAGTGSVTFTIAVTFSSLGKDVTNLAALGCIDNISQSLTTKINAAQNAYAKGQIQTAINILQATIYEVQAQAGKHISTSCKDPNGQPLNPVLFLIGDIQYLQGTLSTQLKPNPILASVVSGNNGIAGATVNVVNSKKTVIATATTDSLGFCYFADTSGFTNGTNYSVNVTLPKGYKSSTPPSQTFTWQGSQVALTSFVLY